MTIDVTDVIDRIPAWRGKSCIVEPIVGGLTNRNFKIIVDGGSYVIRIPGPSSDLLAIDRENERHNTAAAASAGVCPRIAHYLPDLRVMVLDFVRGRTMSIPRLAEPGQPTRIAAALRRLHAGPPFQLDFNMFRLIERYLAVCREREVRIPPDYDKALAVLDGMEQALAARPLAVVPCHNDLLAENYLDDGSRLWIIDFEYSGNNDPCFELGNTCQENRFDADRVRELCAAYFGEARAEFVARMEVYMILSDIGWTLWGAIQAKFSPIDFDFWAWAMEKWLRARDALEGSRLNELLRLVAEPPKTGKSQ